MPRSPRASHIKNGEGSLHTPHAPAFRPLTRLPVLLYGQMMRSTVLFSLVGASAGALELTKTTFNTEVKESGKNAFVKFLAPW